MAVDAALLSIRDEIFSGRLARARTGIHKLARGNLTPEQRLQLAFLANRAFLFGVAASLLHRVVRPGSRRGRPASDEEKAEYARALSELGAANEAIEILREVDAIRLPRINRVLAFAHFRCWQWKNAIAPLKRSLAHPSVSAHEKTLTKIALGTALLHGEGNAGAAEEILTEALVELPIDQNGQNGQNGQSGQTEAKFLRARWEALQMLAQVHYMGRKWAPALECLDRMSRALPGATAGGLTDLLERKWRVLISIERSGMNAAAGRELEALRDGLARLRNWFHLRDLDYYVALATRDTKYMVHLYFGTPFASARSRILRDFSAVESSLPESYDVDLGPAAPGQPRELFETIDGSDGSGRPRLKPGQALQRLLVALVSDFYSPPNIVQLHEALNPGEYFNPASSPVRVRQVLKRLRGWFKRRKLPLIIVEKHDRYALAATRPMRLRLRRGGATVDAALASLLMQTARLGDGAFGAGEVQALAGVTRPTAVSLLNKAVAAGVIERSGRGRGTRYRLAKPRGA